MNHRLIRPMKNPPDVERVRRYRNRYQRRHRMRRTDDPDVGGRRHRDRRMSRNPQGNMLILPGKKAHRAPRELPGMGGWVRLPVSRRKEADSFRYRGVMSGSRFDAPSGTWFGKRKLTWKTRIPSLLRK